jgi:hypothetical protein
MGDGRRSRGEDDTAAEAVLEDADDPASPIGT